MVSLVTDSSSIKIQLIWFCLILQFGLLPGLFLSVVLGISMQFASRLFMKDVDVLWLMHIGIPVRPCSFNFLDFEYFFVLLIKRYLSIHWLVNVGSLPPIQLLILVDWRTSYWKFKKMKRKIMLTKDDNSYFYLFWRSSTFFTVLLLWHWAEQR